MSKGIVTKPQSGSLEEGASSVGRRDRSLPRASSSPVNGRPFQQPDPVGIAGLDAMESFKLATRYDDAAGGAKDLEGRFGGPGFGGPGFPRDRLPGPRPSPAERGDVPVGKGPHKIHK